MHAHQPAGNFPEVIDHAHERCYGPFLRTLADYPAFRFAVHFSGPLLDDLAVRYPDDIELLRQMVARGQVEMFGAGDTEPVLAAIPYRDRLSQIGALSEKLARRFGPTPRVARGSPSGSGNRRWCRRSPAAGSVTRPSTTTTCLCAGRTQDELDRHFTTEEDGHTLDIFPISEALRYRIPFATAGDGRLPRVAGRRRAPGRRDHFDDIEKLGVWPETHEWVYGKRWLREFVERVLASPRIRA